MKYLLSIIISAMAILTMTSCSSKKQQENAAEETKQKSLVLYYSQTGATKAVAEQISQVLGADIEEIELVDPYTGTYDETIQRCMREMADSVIPAIKPIKANLADYDRVFLGYPVWFGTYARPIYGLLAVCDFDGKEVVPFCTFGSGGIEATTADLKASLPKADIKEGYGVRNARIADMPSEVKSYLINHGYVEGEIEELPDYSAPEPVTDDDVAIFNAACGDYQFPLGTPVTVGKRTTANSTDYQYTVNSKNIQGNDSQSTIYVTVSNAEGAKPVFTRVVR